MGRKIFKSNRHKKLKAIDPFYTGERKLTIDKKLVFANQDPVKNEDDQKLPLKLREMMELKKKISDKAKEAKQGQVTKKTAKKMEYQALVQKADDKGAEVPLRPVPNMKRRPNESEKAFLRRIERESELVINRAQYEAQFKCKLETQDDKIVVKKEKKMSEKKREKLQKLKDKIKYKKIKNQVEKHIDESKFKDKIKFGEIAHQPPVLTAVPKLTKKYASQKETLEMLKSKPGAKNLLLKEKLNSNSQQKHIIQFTTNEKSTELNNETIEKRACLTIPNKTANGLTEVDRKAVIDSYRKLKKTGIFEK